MKAATHHSERRVNYVRKDCTTDTIFLLKTRQMCYTVSGDENEEIRDNH